MTSATPTTTPEAPTAAPLDAQVAQLLREVEDLLAAAPAVPPEQALAAGRLAFRGMVEYFRGTTTTPSPTIIADQDVPGEPAVRVRTYHPEGLPATADALLYVHGGGWVAGSPADLDHEMCLFASRLQTRVVSVDFRLAPEHPYPAAFDDCMRVVRHLSEDPAVGRVAVAGDSAGGNLAAAVALACRDAGIPLAAQLLIYPALDPTQGHSSQDAFGVGYGLTRTDMTTYWACYLPERQLWTVPTAAPAAAADLRGLAPAVVVTAGYDPLRDEGDAYAARLVDAGVPTTHLQNPTLPHAFLVMTGRVQAADQSVQRALDALLQRLAH